MQTGVKFVMGIRELGLGEPEEDVPLFKDCFQMDVFLVLLQEILSFFQRNQKSRFILYLSSPEVLTADN